MSEPLEEIEATVQEHGRDSRFHGLIAAFVAVALSGVAALTGRRWLFGLGCGFGAVGLLFGLAGFFRWSLHSDLMARLLG